MKQAFFTSILMHLAFLIQAQDTPPFPPTGKKDTSFNTPKAFRQIKDKYPNVSLVEFPLPPSVKEKKNIPYAHTGSRNLVLDIFYPKKKSPKNRPAIVMIHGGGWRSGDRSQHYALAERLAEKGYVVITPEYRLSTEALYPAAVHDLKAATRWLRAKAKKYQIDTNKITAIGYSAGGQLAALLGTTYGFEKLEGRMGYPQHSSKINAIVDLDGTMAFIHPESGEGNDTKSLSAATLWFGYNKLQKPELWHEAGALNHADKNTAPILFINSSVATMHAGREDIRKILDEFGIYSEVQSFPEAPHTFVLFNPWFEPVLNYITAFLENVYK